ncbi:urease accessory protein UreD [Paenarthrobacter sp. PH39-S1]|uniref:urease accessory protein UreD n=1 Tax=Paenarthrobacter sp. PH39-S1 TaxID=3046204 RepID=UPI0024BA922D|nr:urease accessory protein UreD [Paenarthrobacter sp. PH39-S1]MDJ0355230.1 urease accessory protein UreD [Paenarthrobacter sp. PH39-S1]
MSVSLAAGAAGPLGGDRLRLDIDVAEGATLMLSAVAATVLLPGPHAEESRSIVNIRVAAGAALLWFPGMQIAAEGCRHSTVTRVELAPDARLHMREGLILGRHGERPGEFRQRLRITQGDVPLYDQELAVGAGTPGWEGSAVTGGRRALGAVITVDHDEDRMTSFGTAVSPAFPDTAVLRVSERCAVITSVAPDALALRQRLDAALWQTDNCARTAQDERKETAVAAPVG